MRYLIVLTLLFFGTFSLPTANAGEGADDVVMTYPSYAFDRVYTTIITGEAVKKSPAWLETAENPPVSVRKALKLADAKKQQLVHDTREFKWRRESIAMESFSNVVPHRDFPYWHIHYEAHDVHGETGIPDHLDLFVLMDGSLVEPVVSDAATWVPIEKRVPGKEKKKDERD